MILSNSAILEALDDGRLVIEPEPAPRFAQPNDESKSPYGTTAVDLTLSPVLQKPEPEDLATGGLDPSRGGVVRTLARLSDSVDIDPDQGYELQQNEFVLGMTAERVALPLPDRFTADAMGKPSLAARVEGKSSYARFGLIVHLTAPTIHAGWDGNITLELRNLGTQSIRLQAGEPICQLILEEVRGVPFENRSQFHEQQSPTGS